MATTLYAVLVSRRERTKSTTRTYSTTVDSVWTYEEEAKERAEQLDESLTTGQKTYVSYKTATVEATFLDPARTSSGTAMYNGTRWENDFEVKA